jgi:hypothetical protein
VTLSGNPKLGLDRVLQIYDDEFWDTSTQGPDIKVDHLGHGPGRTTTRARLTLLNAWPAGPIRRKLPILVD